MRLYDIAVAETRNVATPLLTFTIKNPFAGKEIVVSNVIALPDPLTTM